MLSLEDLETWLSQKLAKRDRSEIILYLSIITYVVVFSSLTIVRHYAFKTRAWDLGIFTQSLWTTSFAGRFFYHTCELMVNPSGSFFGVHFSPILFFVLPFYRIFPTVETLLIIQALVLSSAAIPIYKLAKEYIGYRVVSLIFALTYLAYPATQYVNWYDFHVQIFLPLFFSFAIYYLFKERWPKYFLFIFFALMCEEHVAIITFFVGIYVAWKYREQIISAVRRKGPVERKLFVPFITMVISVIWYWFTLWQRNTFFPTNPAALEVFLGSANFTILGAKNPLEIPLLIVLRPLNALQALAYDGHLKLLYLFVLFGPLALFSFKASSLLIPTISWFGFSLISQTLAHHVLGHQYETYVIAFISAAAIFGLRKTFLKKQGLKDISGSLKKLVVCSFIFLVTISPLSPLITTLFPGYASIQIGEHERLLYEVLALIPTNASILTQDNIFPHVSHRVEAYVVPYIFLDSGIRELAIDFVSQTMDKVEFILVDNKTDPTSTSLIHSLLETKPPQFTLIVTEDNNTILLYQRKT
ncbi:DUF2079 domain-containing protein [Candidatus Bathyarchaeota archaeon]|nr:DUF2079 domain-containing protein [Candidatus Bathyarchaeota archaeon]